MKKVTIPLCFLLCLVILTAMLTKTSRGESDVGSAMTEASITSITNALSSSMEEIVNSFFLKRCSESVSYMRNKVQFDLTKKIRENEIAGIRFLSYRVGGFSGTATGINDILIVTNDKIFSGHVGVLFFQEQRGEVAPVRMELSEYPSNPSIVNELDTLLPVLDSLENGPTYPIVDDGSTLCIIYMKPTHDMRCVFMEYPLGYSTNDVALLSFFKRVEKHTESIKSSGHNNEKPSILKGDSSSGG